MLYRRCTYVGFLPQSKTHRIERESKIEGFVSSTVQMYLSPSLLSHRLSDFEPHP
jgi:hypothetical protein